MRPDVRFRGQPKSFWADVRAVGDAVGYTDRRTKAIRVPSLEEICEGYRRHGLQRRHLFESNAPTSTGRQLLEYLEYRAVTLNECVRPNLMDAERANREFERLRRQHNPTCPLPMNKQRGDKRAPAYLTGIVNMLVEANAEGHECDYDPKRLTKITREGTPMRTLSRRVDGAFPSVVDPIAIWEIKEYYYTTTFGSRVADGVYESLLDGLELEELHANEGVAVRHYLMVDARYTWWECGRSYLCRLIDMLHMGLVDEVLFGYEVVERLPELVREWVLEFEGRTSRR